MQQILVLGAGLSSSYLIRYVLEHAKGQWTVTVADANPTLAAQKVNQHPAGKAIRLDVTNQTELEQQIREHHVIVSLLPPTMHPQVARLCVKHKKHLVTASYISDEMKQLHSDAVQAGVLLLNENGLDPGIDHMSAMKLIHSIQQQQGTITTFRSYTGGLVAPEFDNNPWHYKFTWNPRNVVLAGQATASYLEYGELKFIPPSRIFTQTQPVVVENRTYEGYANRDSLSYIQPYGIESAATVIRGTLRVSGYCESWNHLIRLGLTDDSFVIQNSRSLTYRQLLSAFTPGNSIATLEQRVCDFLGLDKNSESFEKLVWLGLFDEQPISGEAATPAHLLQQLLQQKWELQSGDLDMIVMQHQIEYELNGNRTTQYSSLVVKGEDHQFTAMAKTVGLPLGIATRLILENKIQSTGVQMPISPEFYIPILDELAYYGIVFHEHHEA